MFSGSGSLPAPLCKEENREDKLQRVISAVLLWALMLLVGQSGVGSSAVLVLHCQSQCVTQLGQEQLEKVP